MVPTTYKAKDEIVTNGSIARDLIFIKQGLLRVYHLSEGKEITTYFACDNQFISTYTSILTQSPSHEILEAITDSDVLKLNMQRFQQLYDRFPTFERLGRILAEKNYLCISERTIVMQTQTAREKYLNFIDTNEPKIVQQTPQRYIASFLGITPESLSRVRKSLVTSG